MIFRVTRKDIFKYLVNPLIIGLAIDLIFTIGGTIYYNGDFVFALKIFLAILIGQSILYYVPILIFYINYYKKDRNSIFTYDSYHRTYSFKNDEMDINFSEDEIESAHFYLSKPLFDQRTIFLFWHIFYYAKISTVSNNFIVTCLVCDTLDKIIPQEKIEKKWFHISHSIPR